MATEEPIDGRCGTEIRNGEGYCENYPVDGASSCRVHGGTGGAPEGNQNAKGNSGGSAPEGNTNAVTHGMHTNEHAWYSEIASDTEREIVNNVFHSYLERLRDREGEPDDGDKWQLFLCAVTIGKEIHGEKWTVDKPNSLESGTSLIDKETKYTQDGREYHEYKPSVVQRAANTLSNNRRKWLKDMGLLKKDSSDMDLGGKSLAVILSEDD